MTISQPRTSTRPLHVLNLGAGVQSTTLYLMALSGDLGVTLDAAIFADTGEEPAEVYSHLAWMQSLNGPPILIRSRGSRLGDDLLAGKAGWGTPKTHPHHRHRFASIPAFTSQKAGVLKGMTKRQCSKEYKVEVIERTVRRDVLKLLPGRTAAKGTIVYQYIGISLDEAGRASRMRHAPRAKYFNLKFPLIERMMTRQDCKTWLAEHGNIPHETPRSACVFCPYHTDAEWMRVKANPRDWQRAVEVDRGLREEGSAVNRGLRETLFVHRSCQPLTQIEFRPIAEPREQQINLNFNQECLGVCGL